MFDSATPAIAENRDHIEAYRAFSVAVPIRENRGRPANPILLAIVNREFRRPEAIAHARLHFNKYESSTMRHYDVDLGASRAKIPPDDLVASPFQMPRGEVLASFAIWQPPPGSGNRIANPEPQVIHGPSETALGARANTHFIRLDSNKLSGIEAPRKRPRYE